MASWQELKSRAEECFRAEDYASAATGYSAALAALRGQPGGSSSADEAKLLANRCAALQRLGDWDQAIADAKEACQLASGWEKGEGKLRKLPLPPPAAAGFRCTVPCCDFHSLAADLPTLS